MRFAAPALATAAILAAGCGARTAAPPPPGSAAELAWIDNAAGLIAQLDDDVLVSLSGGGDVASARATLRNDSDLVALLMANVSFGSCAESLHNVGVPTGRLEQVATTLTSACAILQRASRLFTRATVQNDPEALIAAARLTRRASPLLRRAKAELDAVRGGRP